MKKSFSLVLTLLLIFGTLMISPATGAEEAPKITADGFTFTIKEDHAVLSKADVSLSGAVTVPGKVTYNETEYPVTELAEIAFEKCGKIESLVLPEGIGKIPGSCFPYCTSLRDIVIPSSVESIEDFAFVNCAFEEIHLTSGLKKIGQCAFALCYDLKRIYLSDTVCEIGKQPLYACTGFEEFIVDENSPFFRSIDEILFNKEVTKLVVYPFNKICEELTVPESV